METSVNTIHGRPISEDEIPIEVYTLPTLFNGNCKVIRLREGMSLPVGGRLLISLDRNETYDLYLTEGGEELVMIINGQMKKKIE